MSRSVCPWCKNPYVENEDGVLVCKNTDCRACAEEFLHKELNRTRKALDLAIEGIEKMTWGCDTTDAERLLKQINEIKEGK